MKRVKLTVLASLVFLLLLCLPIVSLATVTKSFDYTIFETTTITYQNVLDENEEAWEAWTVEILNLLDYNATDNKAPLIRLCGENQSSYHLELAFWTNGEIHVFWSEDGSSSVEIGSGAWDNETWIVVTCDSSGILNIGNSTDNDYIIDEYGLGDFDLKYVGAHGQDGASANSFDAGYVTVKAKQGVTPDVESWNTVMTGVVVAVVPLILLVAVYEKIFRKVRK